MAFDPAEFLAETTEPKKEAAPAAAPVEQPKAAESKFDPVEFLAKTETPISSTPEPQGPVAPQFAVPGPTGISSTAVKQAVSPFMEVGKGVIQGYKANPVGGLADAVLMHGGMPPVFGTAKGFETIKDMYGAAKQTASNVSKGVSQSNLIVSPVTGKPYPESVPDFRSMQKAAPDLAPKLSELYKTGGNNGVNAWLASEEGRAALKANPGLAAAAEQYAGKVPGRFAQIGKVMGPVARAVGKVAGPAGLALNAYDAAQYAQDSQLGQRLAEGQGQNAQKAFRNMTPTYGAPVTPDQEAAVLQNGSQRDIDALIKRKAAQKALQPVAPGTI
jgi:hypothetical protein